MGCTCQIGVAGSVQWMCGAVWGRLVLPNGLFGVLRGQMLQANGLSQAVKG